MEYGRTHPKKDAVKSVSSKVQIAPVRLVLRGRRPILVHKKISNQKYMTYNEKEAAEKKAKEEQEKMHAEAKKKAEEKTHTA